MIARMSDARALQRVLPRTGEQARVTIEYGGRSFVFEGEVREVSLYLNDLPPMTPREHLVPVMDQTLTLVLFKPGERREKP